MRGLTRTLVGAVALLVIAAPTAHAQSEAEQRAALEVFRDYAPDGRIDPCKHSAQELKRAQDAIPPDIEQYAADYPAAIAAAIDARARGACEPSKPAAVAATPSATPAVTATPAATAPPARRRARTVVAPPPGPDALPATQAAATVADPAIERAIRASASNAAPVPVLLLAILAGLLALVAIALLVARRFGVGDDRLADVTHAIREARWRTSGTWQDFLDWLRLGR